MTPSASNNFGSQNFSELSPQRSYNLQASSNETSPLSNEDIIAQKILKRVEIAKMTRQLKEKLFKAGLKVRDQNSIIGSSDFNINVNMNDLNHNNNDGNIASSAETSASIASSNMMLNDKNLTQNQNQNQNLNSSNSTTPSSSPSKSLSEDVTNIIAATAMSNIRNSKLVTPTRQNFSFDNSNISITALTPANISPLKRKSSSIYRSAGSITSNGSSFLYGNSTLENDDLQSPLKRLHSSPYNNASPYLQFTRGSLSTNNFNNQFQGPKTPPQKQIDLFNLESKSNNVKPFTDFHHVKRLPKRQLDNKNILGQNKMSLNSDQTLLPPTQNINLTRSKNSWANDDTSFSNELGVPLDSSRGPSQSSLLSTPKTNRVKEFTTPDRNGHNNKNNSSINKGNENINGLVEIHIDNDDSKNNNSNNNNNHNKNNNNDSTDDSNHSHNINISTNNNNNEEMGADLLLFLSNSPARTFNNKDSVASKILTIPTTPKSSGTSFNINNNMNLLESTPVRNQMPLTQYFTSPSLLGTPIGISGKFQSPYPATPNNKHGALSKTAMNNFNRTPGFSLSDYINFTPSPRIMRTPDHFSHSYNNTNGKPVLNYSKELNMITSIKEDE